MARAIENEDPAEVRQSRRPSVECDLSRPAIEVCKKVFALAELLEHIFSFLTMRDMLRTQRVNRHFNALIQSSTKLKENLWSAPAQHQRLKDCGSHGVVPLRCSGLSIGCIPVDEVAGEKSSTASPRGSMQNSPGGQTVLKVSVFPEMFSTLAIRPDLQRLYLTQPPISVMSFRAQILRFGSLNVVGYIERTDGLRICDLVEKAAELLRQRSGESSSRLAGGSTPRVNRQVVKYQAAICRPDGLGNEQGGERTGKSIWYEDCLERT